MDRIIIVNGVPYICHKEYDMEVLNPNKKGKFIIPGNLTKIQSPYANRRIYIQYKECDHDIDHYCYNTHNDQIFKTHCLFTGTDIKTGEKWVMTCDFDWYKEYTKVFSDESEVTTYISQYENRKGIIEFHFCEASLVSARGKDGNRISVVTTIMGRDTKTKENMVYVSGNWYEMLDDTTRNPIKNHMIPDVDKYTRISDNSTGYIIGCKYLEHPTKMKVQLKNGEEAICIPKYIGRDEQSGELLAYFNGKWYPVKKYNNDILHIIKNDMEKLIEKYEKDQKEKSNKLKTCNFTSIYDGHVVSVKYIELHTTVSIEVFYDKTNKMYVFPNLIGIDLDPNSNQIWVSYFGVWYKACGEPNEILKIVEKNIRLANKESKDLDLFTKECIMSEDQMRTIVNKKNSTKEKVEANIQTLDTTDKNQVDKKYIFPIKNIVANMAKWIYLLDPINPSTKYPVHKVYFDGILHSLYVTLYLGAKDAFDPSLEFNYYDMTEEELRKYLFYIIYNHPYTKDHFSKLNLSYTEMQRKISVSDPNRKTINLSSRFSGPKWEDDFIDLDALINNVVLECVKDAVAAE